MAELGPIKATDISRGQTPVNRSAELGALNTALGLTDKVIEEGARADLRGDLAQVQHDALQSAAAGPTAPSYSEWNAEGGQDDHLVGFLNQMRKHEAMAKQSGVSAYKLRAQQLMEQELQNAKEKYPWMKEKLHQEASMFMNSNPTLTALGMADAAINADSFETEQSQDWIKSVEKTAYDPVTGGGLGIDKRIEFGTVEFAREYNKRMERRGAQQSLILEEQLNSAQDTYDARRAQNIVQRQLEGPEGNLSMVYEEVGSALDTFSRKQYEYRTGLIDEAEFLRYQDEWNRDAGLKIRKLISDAKIGVRSTVTKAFPGSLADEPEAKAWMERAEKHIEDLEVLEATIESGNANIGELIKTFSMMRSHKLMTEGQAMHFRDMLDLVNLAPGIFDLWARTDNTFGSAYDQQIHNEGMGPEIMGILMPSVLDAWKESHRGKDAQSIAKARAEIARNSPSQGTRILGATDREANLSDMGMIEHAYKRSVVPQLSQSSDAEGGQMMLATVSKSLQGIADRVDLDKWDDQQRFDLRKYMATPSWRNSIDAAGKDSIFVEDWLEQMQTSYFNKLDPPKEQIEALSGVAQQTFRSAVGKDFPITRVLIADASRLDEDGIISYSVNTKAIARYIPEVTDDVPNRMNPEFGRGRSPKQEAEDARRALTKQAEEAARYLTTGMTQYIVPIALYNYAKSPTQQNPDYARAAELPFGNGTESLLDILNVQTVE